MFSRYPFDIFWQLRLVTAVSIISADCAQALARHTEKLIRWGRVDIQGLGDFKARWSSSTAMQAIYIRYLRFIGETPIMFWAQSTSLNVKATPISLKVFWAMITRVPRSRLINPQFGPMQFVLWAAGRCPWQPIVSSVFNSSKKARRRIVWTMTGKLEDCYETDQLPDRIHTVFIYSM